MFDDESTYGLTDKDAKWLQKHDATIDDNCPNMPGNLR